MIELSAFPVVCALQGGLHMFSSKLTCRPAPEIQVAPTQVWASLSTDLRTRVIGLFAQLALNVILARPCAEPAEKEINHAYTPDHAQNPC